MKSSLLRHLLEAEVQGDVSRPLLSSPPSEEGPKYWIRGRALDAIVFTR